MSRKAFSIQTNQGLFNSLNTGEFRRLGSGRDLRRFPAWFPSPRKRKTTLWGLGEVLAIVTGILCWLCPRRDGLVFFGAGGFENKRLSGREGEAGESSENRERKGTKDSQE